MFLLTCFISLAYTFWDRHNASKNILRDKYLICNNNMTFIKGWHFLQVLTNSGAFVLGRIWANSYDNVKTLKKKQSSQRNLKKRVFILTLIFYLLVFKQRCNALFRSIFIKLLQWLKSVRIWSFSGAYFSAFGFNTEICRVDLRIQSECGKIGTRKYSNTYSFHAVLITYHKLSKKILSDFNVISFTLNECNTKTVIKS